MAPLVKYTCDVATRAVRSSTARAMASTGTETWSGLVGWSWWWSRARTRSLCPRDGLDRHRDLVRALDHHQLHPTSPLCEPLVGDCGKVERRDHNLGTAPVV